MTLKKLIYALLISFSLVLSACLPDTPTETPANTQVPVPTLDIAALVKDAVAQEKANILAEVESKIEQQVAEAVQAELTRLAQEVPPEPTETQRSVEPTGTPTPTVLAPVGAEFDYQAELIQDVTIPDGTKVTPGEKFIKIWRLQNVGKQTWTKDFRFVFINGNRMEGQAINLVADVPPGGLVDVSIEMIAPTKAGVYTGYWSLQTSANKDNKRQIFGIGTEANQAVYVSIEVVILPTTTPTSAPTP